MSNPTIPPEALEALETATEGSYQNGCDCLDCHRTRYALRAVYPHLRRALLAEVVPQVVEMAREGSIGRLESTGQMWSEWTHDDASILAALEKGEDHQPGGTDDRG